MTEPVSREEHTRVESRLTKTESQLNSLVSAVKSNAESIKRLDENFERSMDTLFRKVDQINSRTQMSPSTVVAFGTFGLVVLGAMMTFVTVVIRPLHRDVERHEAYIIREMETAETHAYDRGRRDQRLDYLELAE